MRWVPLQHPDDRAPAQRDVDVPARLAAFFDAYGLPGPQREQMLDLADRMWQRELAVDAAQRADPRRRLGPDVERGRRRGDRAPPSLVRGRTAGANIPAVTDPEDLLPELPFPLGRRPRPDAAELAGPLVPAQPAGPAVRAVPAEDASDPSTPTT